MFMLLQSYALIPAPRTPFLFNAHYTPGEGKEPILQWRRLRFNPIQSFTPPVSPSHELPTLPPLCSIGPVTTHITNIPLFSASIHTQFFLARPAIHSDVAIPSIFGCVIVIGLPRAPVRFDRDQPTHSSGPAFI